ncbi:MAG: DUF5615 family PIN-like protein [bacterium]
MNIVVDMSLSPEWVETLERHGWPARHWSTIGDPRAEDATILRQYQSMLESGALVTVDEARSRVRLLPIGSAGEKQ